MLEGRLRILAVIHVFQLVGTAQITVVSLSAYYPVVGIIGKVDAANGYASFILRADAVLLGRVGVSDAVTVVAAQSYAQPRHAVVIHAQGNTVFVSYIKLHGRLVSFLNPTRIREVVAVQTSHQLRLVAEILVAAPERDTRLVPRTWHDSALTLRTIDGKEVQWLVVGIRQTHGHHDMTHTEVSPTGKRLLYPKLLQLYLAALLGFLFPLTAFLVFLLVGDARATVLKLYLRAQRPAFAEVVPQPDHGMRYVETPVRGVVLMFFRLTVATHVVAVEVT